VLEEQGRLLCSGKAPALPLVSVQWYIDWLRLGHAPTPLWELPADVADEVRFLLDNVELPEPDDSP
jgi:hypothetical protein